MVAGVLGGKAQQRATGEPANRRAMVRCGRQSGGKATRQSRAEKSGKFHCERDLLEGVDGGRPADVSPTSSASASTGSDNLQACMLPDGETKQSLRMARFQAGLAAERS
jgi:hypothetical protein